MQATDRRSAGVKLELIHHVHHRQNQRIKAITSH
jgi:hypothetical protein